jgi:cyanate permease
MSGERPELSAASYLLLAGGSLGYFLFLFAWFLLPAFLAPVIDGLGLTGTQAGVVAGAVQATYVPLGLASGLVIDRVGARRAIAGGLAVLGAAQALRAGATGFPGLLAGTVALGAGGTAITFGLPKLVSELFPPERTGTMSSVYVVAASAGSGVAFALGRPYLGPLAGGWRPLFRWTGVAVVGFAVVWAIASRLLAGRADRFDQGADGPDRDDGVGGVVADLRAVLGHPQLRLVVVVGTMQLFVFHGLQAWIATALEFRGLTAAAAASVATLLVVARITGTLSVPPLSDRLSTRRWAVIGCGALTAVGLGALLAPALLPVTALVVVVAGVGIGGLAPLMRSIPIELDGIGPQLTGVATGLVFTVGEVGGFAGPFLIGSLRDATGSFLPGFALLAAGGLVVVAAGYLMDEPAGTGPGTDPDADPDADPGTGA